MGREMQKGWEVASVKKGLTSISSRKRIPPGRRTREISSRRPWEESKIEVGTVARAWTLQSMGRDVLDGREWMKGRQSIPVFGRQARDTEKTDRLKKSSGLRTEGDAEAHRRQLTRTNKERCCV